jgi:predicted transposase/invertase (TIGR01784 family)
MLYGVSKLATEYIKEGEPYGTIKKIYSINIVYFALGQGNDYVYEYKGEFVGLHENDVLSPTSLQKQDFKIAKTADIFLKYYLLKVNNFNKAAENTLDEWVYFLKNSEVKDEFRAKGLDKAKEKLRYEELSEEDKKIYDRFQENRRIEKSIAYTKALETKQLVIEDKQEKALEIAKNALKKGADNQFIAEITGLSLEQIQTLRDESNT